MPFHSCLCVLCGLALTGSSCGIIPTRAAIQSGARSSMLPGTSWCWRRNGFRLICGRDAWDGLRASEQAAGRGGESDSAGGTAEKKTSAHWHVPAQASWLHELVVLSFRLWWCRRLVTCIGCGHLCREDPIVDQEMKLFRCLASCCCRWQCESACCALERLWAQHPRHGVAAQRPGSYARGDSCASAWCIGGGVGGRYESTSQTHAP